MPLEVKRKTPETQRASASNAKTDYLSFAVTGLVGSAVGAMLVFVVFMSFETPNQELDRLRLEFKEISQLSAQLHTAKSKLKDEQSKVAVLSQEATNLREEKQTLELALANSKKSAVESKAKTQEAVTVVKANANVNGKNNVATSKEVTNRITPVAFDIQGLKIGDPLTEDFRYHHCPAKDAGKPDQICSQSIEIGGSNVFVMFVFEANKFIGVSLSFDSDAFNHMIEAYTQKFGVAPHSTKAVQVETRLGAKLTNLVAIWETKDGAFTIEKYGDSITTGRAMLHNPESNAYWKKVHDKRTSDLKDQL